MGKSPYFYENFDNIWRDKINSTFEECKDILREKYSDNDSNCDDDVMEMLMDSIWMLCKCADREWSINFGPGKK